MNDEKVKYYKNRYMITFYRMLEDGDEEFVAGFDNTSELCQYKNWPITDGKIMTIKKEINRALKNCPPTTRILNGTEMRLYLIDMKRDDDLEDRLEQERRDKCMANKKYVQISSTINVEVYASLEAIKVVNQGQVGDKLNARSGWTKIRVLVSSGTNWYPSEVLSWPAVKALAAKEIFTIGLQSDTISNPETLEKVEKMRAAINKGKKDVERDKEKANRGRKEESLGNTPSTPSTGQVSMEDL